MSAFEVPGVRYANQIRGIGRVAFECAEFTCQIGVRRKHRWGMRLELSFPGYVTWFIDDSLGFRHVENFLSDSRKRNVLAI